MNFEKLRKFFFQKRPRNKNLLHVLHRCHGFREMSKIKLRWENGCTFEVTLGKSSFLLAWLAFLMSQRITRHKYISNELP